MPPIHPDLIAVARAHEPERYIAATLAPEPQRTGLIALTAFAADLRRIPSSVKDPMIGEIRLQWWRDAITGFAEDATTGHPIADALKQAQRDFNLPLAMLLAMTEARAFDLYPDPMPDDASLDGYIAKTETIPFALALRIAAGAEQIPETAAKTAGHAFGLTRLLADLPHWLARGRLPLPLTRLREANIDADALLRGDATSDLRVLNQQLARDIDATLAASKTHLRRLSRAQRLPLLPLATIKPYLAGINSRARDPSRTPVELAPFTRVWRIARAHGLGPSLGF